MPVTARLSLKFYEKFGEDVANELVEWFNQVDTAYRTDLRELNEVNYARFEAKLDQRLAEFRAELREFKADLIKWMFLFVAGGTLTILGVLVTLLRP